MFTKQEYLDIALILHSAADNHLWNGTLSHKEGSNYSCNSIFYALDDKRTDLMNFYVIRDFLVNEMGFDHDTEHFINMENKIESEIVQALRYDWLKFAAMYAEEKATEFPPSFADVLRLAANKYLVATQADSDSNSIHEMSPYTCDCVGYAQGELTNREGVCCYTPELMEFLHSLGLPYKYDAFTEFEEEEDELTLKINEEKQACRFLWLNFAAEYAESEDY